MKNRSEEPKTTPATATEPSPAMSLGEMLRKEAAEKAEAELRRIRQVREQREAKEAAERERRVKMEANARENEARLAEERKRNAEARRVAAEAAAKEARRKLEARWEDTYKVYAMMKELLDAVVADHDDAPCDGKRFTVQPFLYEDVKAMRDARNHVNNRFVKIREAVITGKYPA